ncbi:uncharacterized protein MELLADRAFT_33785, partial [Melampsora larici-populina 98AG31]
DPVPEEKRTWSTKDYIVYWISDGFSVAVWDMGSSMISNGLSFRQAIPIIATGFTIIAIPITINGTIGAKTLDFICLVLTRASFGYWFSYFPVISRVILAAFWFSIQTFTGGECVYQIIRSIFPSFSKLPNHLPVSSDITTSQFISYLIFWLIQLPFVMMGPTKKSLRHFFLIKSILCPICGSVMFIWALTKGGKEIFKHHSSLSGNVFSFSWLSGMNAAIGNYATLSVNVPDFTRYAKSPKNQNVQLFIIPITFTLIAFQGMVVASAGYVLYDQEYLWDPLRLINKWNNRLAIFSASFCFLIATLGTNISANSLSGANDLTALAPKYINLKRGSFLIAFFGGWAIPSWKILKSSIGFLNFMSGYTVFLGPFSAIMICDFFIVKKGKLDIPELYKPNGRYNYYKGFNWRAIITLLVSVSPNLPGLINSAAPGVQISSGAQHLYAIAWIYGFFTASVVYTSLNLCFPAHETLVEEMIWGNGFEQSDQTKESEVASLEKSSL